VAYLVDPLLLTPIPTTPRDANSEALTFVSVDFRVDSLRDRLVDMGFDLGRLTQAVVAR